MGEEENRRKCSLFFFLALRARFVRELADVFEKNEKKNKTTSVYRTGSDGSRKERGARKRHSCLPRVPSLPADVLWGSFVTHSFLPQRTSAGRLSCPVPYRDRCTTSKQ